MKALLCPRPFELQIIDSEEPMPSRDKAVVRVRRAGVCGTDLHIFEGTQPYFEYPRVIGHELSGEVAAVGAGSRFRVGQRVAVIPYLHCGTCVACRQGKTNCCRTLNVIGVHSDGGMAEAIAIPERNLFDAESVSLDEAAMIEFLAIGAHATRRAAVKSGQRALVVGCGPIGVATALFAQIAGADVTVLDGREDRLDFVRRSVCAARAVTLSPDARKQLADATDGDFFDCVFDCTGSRAAMEAGFAYVGHGGTYVLVGLILGDVTFSDPEFHKRETTLLGSRNATAEDFANVLAAMRAGRIPIVALATHRVRLEDAPAAFPEWLKPETRVLKALIEI